MSGRMLMKYRLMALILRKSLTGGFSILDQPALSKQYQNMLLQTPLGMGPWFVWHSSLPRCRGLCPSHWSRSWKQWDQGGEVWKSSRERQGGLMFLVGYCNKFTVVRRKIVCQLFVEDNPVYHYYFHMINRCPWHWVCYQFSSSFWLFLGHYFSIEK